MLKQQLFDTKMTQFRCKILHYGLEKRYLIVHVYEVLYMKSKGSNTSHNLIYNILSSVITNSVATNYSFYEQKHKRIFSSLTLCSCVYHAVKLQFANVSEEDVKRSIKRWLDSSKTRLFRAQTQATKRKIFQPIIPAENDDPEV